MTSDELRYVFFNRKPITFNYPNVKPIPYKCINQIEYSYVSPEVIHVNAEMQDFCGHSSTMARLRYITPSEPIPDGAQAPEIEFDSKIRKAFLEGKAVAVNSPAIGKMDFDNIHKIEIRLTDDNKAEIYCVFQIDRFHTAIEVPIKYVKTKSKGKVKPINYKAILELFKELCPELPQPQKLTDARRKAIRAAQEDGVDFGVLFRKVHQSEFLTTKCKACGFDWVLKPSNRAKILEGNYDDVIDLEPHRKKPYDIEGPRAYDIDELDKIQ